MSFPALSTDTEQKLQDDENDAPDTLVFALSTTSSVTKLNRQQHQHPSGFPKRVLPLRRHSSSHSAGGSGVGMSALASLSTKAKVHDLGSLKTSATVCLKTYSTSTHATTTTTTTVTVVEKERFEFVSSKLAAGRREILSSRKLPDQSVHDLGKLTVVLDVDETLIHSRINQNTPQSTFRQAENRKANSAACDEFLLTLTDGDRVNVNKRPFLDEFLHFCKDRFEIVAFTAGLKQYAEPLLDCLDPKGEIFKHRLYRDSCLFVSGYYVKDLQLVNRNMKRTVLVDNNPICFLPQLNNGLPISNFYDDPNDQALKSLMNYLVLLEKLSDIRPKLKENFGLEKMLKNKRNEVLGDNSS